MAEPMHNLEELTRRRLAKLSGRPVDASRVARRVEAELGGQRVEPRRRVVGWLSAAAAVVLLVLGLAVMNHTASPVVAAPAELVQLHKHVASGGHGATTVRSIDEAQRAIAAQWPDAPELPAPPTAAVDGEQVMACCLGHIGSRKLACVLIEGGDRPVTMVVANAKDVKPAEGDAIERDGRRFYTHEMRGVNMVATQRGERYICLMGEVPIDRLIEIAQRLGR